MRLEDELFKIMRISLEFSTYTSYPFIPAFGGSHHMHSMNLQVLLKSLQSLFHLES